MSLRAGLLGTEALARFDWKLAIGETTLTEEELIELAAAKEPLIRIGGRWHALRRSEVEKAISELTVQLQRSPSVPEIAKRLECDPTDVLEVLEANHNRRPLSLDRPVGGEDSEESPASEWVGDEDSGFELVEDKLALEGALPHLDERERLVLQLRFVDDLTQSQIAEKIGHSQMHVSRILRRTLERIRAEVAEQSKAASDAE